MIDGGPKYRISNIDNRQSTIDNKKALPVTEGFFGIWYLVSYL